MRVDVDPRCVRRAWFSDNGRAISAEILVLGEIEEMELVKIFSKDLTFLGFTPSDQVTPPEGNANVPVLES